MKFIIYRESWAQDGKLEIGYVIKQKSKQRSGLIATGQSIKLAKESFFRVLNTYNYLNPNEFIDKKDIEFEEIKGIRFWRPSKNGLKLSNKVLTIKQFRREIGWS